MIIGYQWSYYQKKKKFFTSHKLPPFAHCSQDSTPRLHRQYPLRSVIYIFAVSGGTSGAANTTYALKNIFYFALRGIGGAANTLELS